MGIDAAPEGSGGLAVTVTEAAAINEGVSALTIPAVMEITSPSEASSLAITNIETGPERPAASVAIVQFTVFVLGSKTPSLPAPANVVLAVIA